MTTSTPVISGETPKGVTKVKGFNAMIVEASNSCRNTISNVLTESGYDVYAYDSFEKALEALNDTSVSFELAVIDFNRKDASELNETEKHLVHKLKSYRTSTDYNRQFQQDETNYTGILGIFLESPTSTAIVNDDHSAAATTNKNTVSQTSLNENTLIDVIVNKPMTWQQFMKNFERALVLSLDHAKVIDLQLVFDLFEDTDLLNELVHDLLTQTRLEIDSLEEAINNEDMTAIDHSAHTLKGSSAQMFAKPLSQAAFVIERAAKEKNTEPFGEGMHLLRRRLNELEKFVNEMQL